MNRLSTGLLLLALAQAGWGQDQALVDGQPVVVEFPAVASDEVLVNRAFFIDVPEDATSLRVSLTAADPNRDVDVLLRSEPFPGEGAGPSELFGAADYYSGGLDGRESVEILSSAQPPAAGQRWYFAILAFPGSAGSAELTAELRTGRPDRAEVIIDFDNRLGVADCDTAPWNDPTAFTPTAGNGATTLGEARRNALQRAIRAIRNGLFSPVPITVRACWEDIEPEDEGSGTTLAFARSNLIAFNTPGAPEPDTFYSQAAITRLAGTEFCRLDSSVACDEQDLFITFNEAVDNGGLGERSWYYGFNPDLKPTNQVDFIFTAIHELSHGLGFFSLLREDGALPRAGDGRPLTDAYTSRLADNRDGLPVSLADPTVSDADRRAAITSVTGLQWLGPEASIRPDNPFATQESGLIRLHAPASYEPGSSVSHLSQAYCDVMRPDITDCPGAPFRSLRLTRPMLHELGWAPAGDRPPFLGLWFDRSRDGHGFELAPGGFDAAGKTVYVLTFYSYDNLGFPEWFQAIGTIQDGTFAGVRNADEIGFPRFTYDADRTPPQEADPDYRAQVALSFNDPQGSDACDDGIERTGAQLASFQWVTNRRAGSWCVEPLTAASARPESDFGGLWYAGEEDTGWGFTIENIQRDGGVVDLFVLLYVYDAEGLPVWYFAFESDVDFSAPITMTLVQRQGSARTVQGGPLSDAPAGTLTLLLGDPDAGLDGSNRADVDVTYLGAEGGSWVRSDVPIVRLSQPRD